MRFGQDDAHPEESCRNPSLGDRVQIWNFAGMKGWIVDLPALRGREKRTDTAFRFAGSDPGQHFEPPGRSDRLNLQWGKIVGH